MGSPALTPKDRWLFRAFFFILAQAIALWFVPFSNVLKTHGQEALTPYALASTALAALISPLFVGSLADRHLSATRLLGWLSLATSASLCLTFFAIQNHWGAPSILALFELQQLCAQPVWGLASMIVLACLPNPGEQFGSIRVWGTFGWVFACLLVSLVLHADTSPLTGFVSAGTWVLVAILSLFLPPISPQASSPPRRWQETLGLESLSLLQVPLHRAVFLTAGLLSIPLAAFYPYAALQLRDCGFDAIAAAMSLGQVTEAVAMYALAPLLSRYPLRSLLLAAILTAILRYLLFATGHLTGLLTGILLHGICFTLFFIPAQIYIERYVDKAMRFRAQALMTLLISGFGNFFGYLGCGWLRSLYTQDSLTEWSTYWTWLAAAVAAVGVYFVSAFPRSASQKL